MVHIHLWNGYFKIRGTKEDGRKQDTQFPKRRQRKSGVNGRQGSDHGGNGHKGVFGKSGRLNGTTGLQDHQCRSHKQTKG